MPPGPHKITLREMEATLAIWVNPELTVGGSDAIHLTLRCSGRHGLPGLMGIRFPAAPHIPNLNYLRPWSDWAGHWHVICQ